MLQYCRPSHKSKLDEHKSCHNVIMSWPLRRAYSNPTCCCHTPNPNRTPFSKSQLFSWWFQVVTGLHLGVKLCNTWVSHDFTVGWLVASTVPARPRRHQSQGKHLQALRIRPGCLAMPPIAPNMSPKPYMPTTTPSAKVGNLMPLLEIRSLQLLLSGDNQGTWWCVIAWHCCGGILSLDFGSDFWSHLKLLICTAVWRRPPLRIQNQLSLQAKSFVLVPTCANAGP